MKPDEKHLTVLLPAGLVREVKQIVAAAPYRRPMWTARLFVSEAVRAYIAAWRAGKVKP